MLNLILKSVVSNLANPSHYFYRISVLNQALNNFVPTLNCLKCFWIEETKTILELYVCTFVNLQRNSHSFELFIYVPFLAKWFILMISKSKILLYNQYGVLFLNEGGGKLSSKFEVFILIFSNHLQGPRNSGFNGFIWTHQILEVYTKPLSTYSLIFKRFIVKIVNIRKYNICFIPNLEAWTHELKSIKRVLYNIPQEKLSLLFSFCISNQKDLTYLDKKRYCITTVL